MKKLFALVLAFMLALSVVPAMAESYQGTAQGRNGEIVVEMTVENGVITNVAVVSHQETAGIADPALTQIPQAIVDGQTLAVDTVASATITCDAIIEAAKAAATAAGLDVDKLMVKADAEAVIGESTGCRCGCWRKRRDRHRAGSQRHHRRLHHSFRRPHDGV